MPTQFTDQLFHTVRLSDTPQRIVSLVPSQTEFLFDIGAGSQVCGVTKYCVHPNHAKQNAAIVGGTKNYNLSKIRDLAPDLIIANKEENVKQSIDQLKQEFPVWTSDVQSLEDAVEMMSELGRMTGHEKRAEEITSDILDKFNNLPKLPPKRTLYMIWKEPYMVVGKGTFIDHLMTRIGLINIASHMSRYPSLSDMEIRDLNPELILLSSEPYPFKEEHAEELSYLCKNSSIKLVDGEYFSWYGSRLKKSADHFSSLLF